jgi:hypothetical protein
MQSFKTAEWLVHVEEALGFKRLIKSDFYLSPFQSVFPNQDVISQSITLSEQI